jgi:glycopeptide antibiotics resistance protein
MRLLAALWLLAWALIGTPWRSFSAPSLQNVRLVPFQDGSPRSQVLNVLAFVPWGMVGMGLGWSAARAVATGAAISSGTELLQLFSTRRYPSTTDVLLNTGGTALGAALVTCKRRSGARSAP